MAACCRYLKNATNVSVLCFSMTFKSFSAFTVVGAGSPGPPVRHFAILQLIINKPMVTC
jgi:hypothetical protein